MDLKKLDFNDNTFDVVVSFETLEHVEGYTQMLSEFRRVLKKRGLLIVSTPNKRTFGCDLDVPFDKYHVTEFYHDEFKDLIDKAGFQIVDFLGQSPTRNVRWIYSLRCFVVRFPILGKIISDRYQRRMESSGNKADDTVINFLLRVIGVSLSLKRIKIISKSPSSAIYFIAVCRKT